MKWSEPPPGLKKEEGDSRKSGTVPRILPEYGDCPLISYAMEGFWTFPDFRHVVQTRMRRMVPSTTARTRCKFGFQRRLVTLCACEMLLPKRGPFPQISQTLAMLSPYILLREAIKTFFLFRCQPGENLGTVPRILLRKSQITGWRPEIQNPKCQIPNKSQNPKSIQRPKGEAKTAQRRRLYG